MGNLPTTKGFGFHISQTLTVDNSVDLQTPAGQSARLISLFVRGVVTEQYIVIVPRDSLMFLSDLPLAPLQFANLSAAVSATQIDALGIYGHQASDLYKGESWPIYRSGLIYPPVNRRVSSIRVLLFKQCTRA
jgi:hypothetical protein